MLDRIRSKSASLKIGGSGGVEIRRMSQFCGTSSASVRSPTGVKSPFDRIEMSVSIPS
jgi:hypothetical protein